MIRLKKFYTKQKALVLLSLFFLFPSIIFFIQIRWVTQYFLIFPNLSAFIFCMLNISAWYWSIANSLYQKLPQKHWFNLKLFNIALYFAAICVILLPFISAFILQNIIIIIQHSRINEILLILETLLPIIWYITVLYCIYQLARLIRMVEFNRKVHLQELIGEILALIFLPFGIWYIQAKIRSLVQKPDVYDKVDLSDHLLDS